MQKEAEDKAKSEKPHPKAALMARLAKGTRVEMGRKEMKELTCKNYENLPEVKKKREEEKKKQEMLRRRAQAKEYEVERRQQMRSRQGRKE
jgi:alstrom syndrome protein 1